MIAPATISNHKVLFFVQIGAALIVILAAIINLSVPSLAITAEQQNYWKIALGSTIGYLFPSPTTGLMKKIE